MRNIYWIIQQITNLYICVSPGPILCLDNTREEHCKYHKCQANHMHVHVVYGKLKWKKSIKCECYLQFIYSMTWKFILSLLFYCFIHSTYKKWSTLRNRYPRLRTLKNFKTTYFSQAPFSSNSAFGIKTVIIKKKCTPSLCLNILEILKWKTNVNEIKNKIYWL